jgi:hypothetical protein
VKYRIHLLLPVLVVLFVVGCPLPGLDDALVGAARLDALCVTGYSVTIKPPSGPFNNRTIEFAAVLSNPKMEDAKGSVRLLMGVDAAGLNLPGAAANISAQSQAPSFETPVSTTYPANRSDAYTSPALVSLPYDPNANYTIEIHKWMVGVDTWDTTPCHNCKITKKFPQP